MRCIIVVDARRLHVPLRKGAEKVKADEHQDAQDKIHNIHVKPTSEDADHEQHDR